MEKEIFDINYQNENVIKLISGETCYLYHKKDDIVIRFAFYHDPNILPSCLGKKTRIFFKVLKSEKFQDPIPKKYVGDKILFLVNADSPELAILFGININNNILKLKLIEKPLLGEELLTFFEKNGIVKYINR